MKYLILFLFLSACGSNPQTYAISESVPNGYGVTFCSACPANTYPNTVPISAECVNDTLLGDFGGIYSSLVLGQYVVSAPHCYCVFNVKPNCIIEVLDNQSI